MLTDQERELINQYNTSQALLAPFKRILEGWAVQTGRGFTSRLSELDLVATGNLTKEWKVQVRARGGASEFGAAIGKSDGRSVIVAEFIFPEYGRYFDMRRVEYNYPPSAKEGSSLYDWVKLRAEQGRILYSDRARSNGLPFTNPRILHDLTYRIAKSKFALPRKRWYNKGKSASIYELYDELQAAMAEAALIAAKADFNIDGIKRRGRKPGS